MRGDTPRASIWATAWREVMRVTCVFLTHVLIAALVVALAWGSEAYLTALFGAVEPLLLGVVPLRSVVFGAAAFVSIAVIVTAPIAALRAR